ncbi:CoB--CoM heterodisulfide reductase iron-sulfur subunit A family protein [bacterium]|nr:CoB--CoM heterodisulfide reductase iron-sulfur subunit A family protein [bacterium]
MARIGVFVCWCGSNIAETVDVKEVAKYAGCLPGVVISIDNKYMCSDPGQRLILDAIQKEKLTGVVVAACSPRMHEVTYRRTVAQIGFNPYMLEMANLREHCSWVHPDKRMATEKAKDLVRLMVEKVKRNQPLYNVQIPVTKKALVIGGGIAGIQAALDIAQGGYEVILVEKSPSIGGHMAQLDETFPTLDCSQCILTPRMVEVAQNTRIRLYTYSEVEAVDGYIGNFQVTIRKKARSVDIKKCTGCGQCIQKCPTKTKSEFDAGMGIRKAIYVPFPQAVPNKPVIDRDICLKFTKDRCGACQKVCPTGAINYEQQDEFVTEDVGAIICATGYELTETHIYPEYGNDPDIISGLQFERLVSASGPTLGELKRPSDGNAPQSIVFLQCVGSRDPLAGRPYCSKICCMYTAKHTMLYRHKVHNGKAYVFYMDIRAGGKNYDEFVRRAIEEDHAIYIRGRVSRIYRKGEKLIVLGADTLLGAQVEIEADMIVLATATVAPKGIEKLAQMLGVSYDLHNFMCEAHPKLRPVETNSAGVYLAGACQAPKDIPESVAQAGAAASKVLGLFGQKELSREPIVAQVNQSTCAGCFTCKEVCAYKAIEIREIKDKKGNLIKFVAEVNKGKCQGCGACAATCRSNSIELCGFTDSQIFSQINHLTDGVTIEEPPGEVPMDAEETQGVSEETEKERLIEKPALAGQKVKN